MIEARAIVENVEKTKEKVNSLGGEFKSHYAFNDIIFVPRKKNYNLSKDFVRVRVYSKTNWPTKDVVLVRKKTEWKEEGKVDKVIVKEEFDTVKKAFDFIEKNLPDFEKAFEYSREGWQYQLSNNRIFIEDIKGYNPSIEIEAKDEEELHNLFEKIGVVKLVRDSVPESMRKKLT